MSDLFHKQVPRDFVARACDTMERANWHTFQILTKRSSRLRVFLEARYAPSRGATHMGFGVFLEDRAHLSRVRHLCEAPAGIRFLSIEPLIGPAGPLVLADTDWRDLWRSSKGPIDCRSPRPIATGCGPQGGVWDRFGAASS